MIVPFALHARPMRKQVSANLFVALCTLCSSIALAAESELKAGFFAGGSEQSEFWGSMGRFAEAVAEDLSIDLVVVYPGEKTFERDGRALLDDLSEGAYFVTAYVDPIIGRLLQTSEDRGIRTVLINTDVIERDREQIGKPREGFRHWIGHMQPDDVRAGYEVADLLFQQFERPNVISMIAINGNNNVRSDADRRAGLKRRLAESEGATLHEIREGQWSEATARTITIDLLQKHQSVNAIWAASDSMALGAIAAVRQIGKRPGKDIVVAGVDWTGRGLEAVRAGDMAGTVGGHYMEAGVALLLIYDYHHGHDFADELGISFKTPMSSISNSDINRYLEKVRRSPDWSRIDFKRFTKTHNPDLKRYDFSWERIVEQL